MIKINFPQLNADRAWRNSAPLAYDEVAVKFEGFVRQRPAEIAGTNNATTGSPGSMALSPAIVHLAESLLNKASKRKQSPSPAKESKRKPQYCNQFNTVRGCQNTPSGGG